MTKNLQKTLKENIYEIVTDALDDLDTREEQIEYCDKVQDKNSNEFNSVVNQLMNDYGWSYGDWENDINDEVYHVIDFIATNSLW